MLTTPAIELAQLAVVWGLPLQGDPGGSLSSISGAAPLVLPDLLHRTLLAFVAHANLHLLHSTASKGAPYKAPPSAFVTHSAKKCLLPGRIGVA